VRGFKDLDSNRLRTGHEQNTRRDCEAATAPPGIHSWAGVSSRPEIPEIPQHYDGLNRTFYGPYADRSGHASTGVESATVCYETFRCVFEEDGMVLCFTFIVNCNVDLWERASVTTRWAFSNTCGSRNKSNCSTSEVV